MRHKCHHLSLSLECMAGGEGNIACIDPKFHEKCPIKHAAEHKEMERKGRELKAALRLE